jgi:hypothetical protein
MYPFLGMNGLPVSPNKMNQKGYLSILMMMCGIMLDKLNRQFTI